MSVPHPNSVWIGLIACLLPLGPAAAQRQPVIDAHLHAFTSDWVNFWKDTSWFPPGRVANSDSLLEQSLRTLRDFRVVKAVASGTDQAVIDRWRKAAPDRIIPALVLTLETPLDTIRARVKDGRIKALGEAVWQYQGLSPDDPRLEPFYALAEELDVPIGIHLGLAPPGVQRERRFRAHLGDPLALENVLARHPKLRVWVMHAGWPFAGRMLALLWSFPQVYVDLALVNGILPPAELKRYVRQLIDAGFGKNIMYGSDQAVWTDVVPRTIKTLQAAPWLSPDEKRDILCRNAARFFRLEPALCGP